MANRYARHIRSLVSLAITTLCIGCNNSITGAFTPPPVTPPTPLTVVAPIDMFSVQTAQNAKITLSWQTSLLGSAPSHFDIYRGATENVDTTGAALAVVAGTVTSYEDTAVVNGTQYFYAVKSRNSKGSQEVPAQVLDGRPWDPTSAVSLNNVFVDFSAGVNGDGSFASPFNKLTDGDGAYALVNSGGTINIFDSTWTGANLALTKSLTIRSMTGTYQTSAAILDGSGLLFSNGGVLTEATIKIKGLEIRNWTTNNYFYGNGYRHLEFYGNYFHDNSHFFHNYNNPTFGFSGLTYKVINNRIENLNGAFKSALILVGMANSNFVIVGNYISTIAWNALQITNNPNSTVLIQNNIIKDTQDNGVQLNASNGTVEVLDNQISGAGLSLSDSTNGCLVFWDLGVLVGSINVSRNYFHDCINAISTRNVSFIQADADRLSISNNYFELDVTSAFYIGGASVANIDASDNFWGSANGPTHTSIPTGDGAAVPSSVVVSPFKSEWLGIAF